CRGCAHRIDALLTEVLDGAIQIIDVERDVVAPEVAVAGVRGLSVCGLVEEYLEVRSMTQPVEPDLADHRPLVHAQMNPHPVVLRLLGAECVDLLAAEYVHEEVMGLSKVRDVEAQMIRTSQARDPALRLVVHKTSMSRPDC